MSQRSLFRAGATIALVLLSLSGCSTLNPGTDAAARTVQQFHEELAAGDAAKACTFLAPKVIDSLEGGEEGSCAERLGTLSLPPVGPVRSSQAYGRSAQVILDADTLFLTRSGAEWKITAAGCSPRGERPYDCELVGD